MAKPSPTKVFQATTIGYWFLLVLIYHMFYTQINNKIRIQSHLCTYFEQSPSKIYLEHDAIGIELQLHVPEVLSMGYKTLKAHYQYYLTLFNSSVPEQGPKSDQDHLQQLHELYSTQIQLYPSVLSPAHYAAHHAAMILQQQFQELSQDLQFPLLEDKHHDRQQTRKWYSRAKRGLDINIDRNKMIQSFFNGVLFIFQLHSISELCKGLRNQAKKLDSLTQFTFNYARKTTILLLQLANQVNDLESQFQGVTMDQALILVSSEMARQMLTGLNNLYQGIIPVSAMTPSEATSIYQSLQQQERAADLHLVLKGPEELFKLKATTYVTDTNPSMDYYVFSLGAPEQTPIYDFFVFITVLTVKPSKGLSAYHLYNNNFQTAFWRKCKMEYT